ncbi:MAG TPA: hypothetical protein VK914_06845 [bacterium]|jgi:hypothetical protein|nr:hypothetical protein [bacterium]
MAAKKRPSKSASPRRGAPRRTTSKPLALATPTPPPLPTPQPEPSRPYGVIVLGLAVVAGLICWSLMHHNPDQPAASSPVPAAPAPAVAATSAPAPTAAPAQETAAAPRPRHHEDSGKVLVFSLSSGKPLTLKCWRSADGVASLAIFGKRNTRVFSVSSDPGAEGWQALSWDGHDDKGALVPLGRYYALPSQKAATLILALKVKN